MAHQPGFQGDFYDVNLTQSFLLTTLSHFVKGALCTWDVVVFKATYQVFNDVINSFWHHHISKC